MGILALPPSGIITDNDGIVIGRSSDGKGYLLTGGTEGQVPVIQGDGTIAYGAAGASSLSELDDWAANTLTVPGALTVRQNGGVAGTDEIQIYHDGTNAYIDAQSGDLIFNNSNAKVNSSGEFTNNAGLSGQERFGAANNGGGFYSTSLGYNTTVASQTVAVGYGANGHNRSVVLGRQAGGGFQNVVAIGAYATGSGIITASVSAIAIGTGGSTLTATRVHAAAGECVIGGQGGISNFYLGGVGSEYGLTDVTISPGGRTGTDLDGYNLILAGGKPTGAGTPGQVQFQVAPSGASGTTLGTLTTVGLFDEQGLTVRQAGGVAGTDEVQIYHDGTDGFIVSQSGNLKVGSTLQTLDGAYNNTTLQIGSTVGYGFSIWQSRIWLRSGSHSICSIGTDSVSYRSNLQLVWGTSNVFAFAGDDSGIGRTSSGRLKVTNASTGWGEMISQGWALNERSSDPSDPAEGQSVLWQSDGTGSGDDGDIMIKITASGVTKTATLIDFSTV